MGGPRVRPKESPKPPAEPAKPALQNLPSPPSPIIPQRIIAVADPALPSGGSGGETSGPEGINGDDNVCSFKRYEANEKVRAEWLRLVQKYVLEVATKCLRSDYGWGSICRGLNNLLKWPCIPYFGIGHLDAVIRDLNAFMMLEDGAWGQVFYVPSRRRIIDGGLKQWKRENPN